MAKSIRLSRAYLLFKSLWVITTKCWKTNPNMAFNAKRGCETLRATASGNIHAPSLNAHSEDFDQSAHADWSKSSLDAFWIAKGTKFLNAENGNSDHTTRIHMLILTFTARSWHQHVSRVQYQIGFLLKPCLTVLLFIIILCFLCVSIPLSN